MDQIRNVGSNELYTDVPRKDGRGELIIQAGQMLDMSAVNEKDVVTSLKNGKLKGFVDFGYIKVGAPILGDKKKAKKITAKEAGKGKPAAKEEKKENPPVKPEENKTEEIK